MQQELVGMVVGDDDEEIGAERFQALADLAHGEPHALDRRLVLGLGQREELRRMRNERAAQNPAHGSSH